MYDDIEMLGYMLDGEEDDDELMGRRVYSGPARAYRRAGGRRTVVSARKRTLMRAKRALVPAIPGAPGNALRGFALGFPIATFTSGGPTTIEVQASPQLAFKGARLVVVVSRAGATSTGLVTISTFLVGQRDQRVSGGALLAEAYAPNAFQTVMALDQATPGIDIRLGFTLTGPALAGADTVLVGSQIIGATIA